MITRAITQNEQLWYQLYRQPIPLKDLEWEDLQDGEMRMGGSIRGAFSNNERSESEFNQISSKVAKTDRYLKCGGKKTIVKNFTCTCHKHVKLCLSSSSQELFPSGVSQWRTTAVTLLPGQRCLQQTAVAQLHSTGQRSCGICRI